MYTTIYNLIYRQKQIGNRPNKEYALNYIIIIIIYIILYLIN